MKKYLKWKNSYLSKVITDFLFVRYNLTRAWKVCKYEHLAINMVGDIYVSLSVFTISYSYRGIQVQWIQKYMREENGEMVDHFTKNLSTELH